MAAQKSRLEASLRLQQFLRDVEDEETWVKEREQVGNTGKGAGLMPTVVT